MCPVERMVAIGIIIFPYKKAIKKRSSSHEETPLFDFVMDEKYAIRQRLLPTFLWQSRSPAVVASNSGGEDTDADAGDGAERFATGKKGGASSENVVDKKDVLACKRVRGHIV